MSRNDRLRTVRVLLRLTQLQLAEMSGTKEINISRYETGPSTTGPRDETADFSCIAKADFRNLRPLRRHIP